MDVDKIIAMDEDGLKIVEIAGKGKGVAVTRVFKKDEVICEYRGKCISLKEAKSREKELLKIPGSGCFLYYFTYNRMTLWLVVEV